MADVTTDVDGLGEIHSGIEDFKGGTTIWISIDTGGSTVQLQMDPDEFREVKSRMDELESLLSECTDE